MLRRSAQCVRIRRARQNQFRVDSEMAVIESWTLEQTAAWEHWVSQQPQVVRDLANRFPPYLLYRLKASGHRVTIKGYSEDGTLFVGVSGTFNAVLFNRMVRDVPPSDLEECDLPGKSERLGAVFDTEQGIDAYLRTITAGHEATRH